MYFPKSQTAYDHFREELPFDLVMYKDIRKMAFPITKYYMRDQDIYRRPGNKTNSGRTFDLYRHRVFLNSYPDYLDAIYNKKKKRNYCDMYELLPRDPGTSFSFYYNWI